MLQANVDVMIGVNLLYLRSFFHVYIINICFRLVIRGSETDSAVLCTANETFEIKEAETSNSLLILPHCSITTSELDASNEPSSVCRQVRMPNYHCLWAGENA